MGETEHLMHIPVLYIEQFRNNPEESLKDLAGIPPAVESPFMTWPASPRQSKAPSSASSTGSSPAGNAGPPHTARADPSTKTPGSPPAGELSTPSPA